MTPERAQRIREVVNNRQTNLGIVLENVHDPHNIGAVLRTCDSVGIYQVFILITDPRITPERLEIGKKASSGAVKWMEIFYYQDVDACFREVKKRFEKIYGTHLDSEAVSLHELDLTQSVALVFGNEHDGISPEVLSYCDGNFIIPQMGMVQSLNISVACAITLYEAFRQRLEKGEYQNGKNITEEEASRLEALYKERHEMRYEFKGVRPIK